MVEEGGREKEFGEREEEGRGRLDGGGKKEKVGRKEGGNCLGRIEEEDRGG